MYLRALEDSVAERGEKRVIDKMEKQYGDDKMVTDMRYGDKEVGETRQTRHDETVRRQLKGKGKQRRLQYYDFHMLLASAITF